MIEDNKIFKIIPNYKNLILYFIFTLLGNKLWTSKDLISNQ